MYYLINSVRLPFLEAILTLELYLKKQNIGETSFLSEATQSGVNTHTIAAQLSEPLLQSNLPLESSSLKVADSLPPRGSKTFTCLISCPSFIKEVYHRCYATVSLDVSPKPNTLVL